MPSSKFTIPGFIRLAPSIYLQDPNLQPLSPSTPPKDYSDDDLPPPELIILCTWTAALPHHINKYTSSYNTLFPRIPILLLTTSIPELAFFSTSHKTNSLRPAVSFLLTRQSPSHPPTQPGKPLYSHSTTPIHNPYTSILLHAFSEGGSFTTVSLATLYLSLSQTHIPISALILDSTPGQTPSFTQARKALQSTSTPHSFLLSPFLSIPFLLNKSFISQTREALNNPALFTLEGIPRLYLFSEADDIVLWKEVERHAKEAKIKSLCVRFKATKHCAHVCGGKESKVYWAGIKGCWGMRGDGGLGIRLRGLGGGSGGGGKKKRVIVKFLTTGSNEGHREWIYKVVVLSCGVSVVGRAGHGTNREFYVDVPESNSLGDLGCVWVYLNPLLRTLR
ncbi:hypothetical protein QBC38DRAFT_511078 [Podospora fimiseda]|uniref:Uncharacterized protein n=1 Tax=Podospora fimiseda TaxID=252190 RepID=A0AAN7BLG4_9PEZI|nr:hypothetical protein QBC38DRAFT_511078 [Podospora fimiseda]